MNDLEPSDTEPQVVTIGETSALAVIDGERIFGYPYFTIRRWTLSDTSLQMTIDSGSVEIVGAGLLKLLPLIQSQKLMSLRVLPSSIASDCAGDVVVTAHSFFEAE